MVIPTADLICPGEFGIEPQYDGVFSSNSGHAFLLNTQFGLTPRLEAGLDFDLSNDSDNRLLTNFKYLVLQDSEHRPAVAVGVCSMAPNIKSSPYVVATQDFESFRGHLGVMRTEDNNRWFVGADKAMNDRFTLMADYTSGDENCSSIGFSYQKTDRFGILAGMIFPNDSKEDTGFSVHLVFSGI